MRSLALADNVLDSWKEIATFLKRGVRTVQRWEHTENLPVHRHQHQKRGSVYALRSEVTDWLRSRGLKSAPNGQPANGNHALSKLHLLASRQVVLARELSLLVTRQRDAVAQREQASYSRTGPPGRPS